MVLVRAFTLWMLNGPDLLKITEWPHPLPLAYLDKPKSLVNEDLNLLSVPVAGFGSCGIPFNWLPSVGSWLLAPWRCHHRSPQVELETVMKLMMLEQTETMKRREAPGIVSLNFRMKDFRSERDWLYLKSANVLMCSWYQCRMTLIDEWSSPT